MTTKLSPPSPKIKDFINAFFIGGLICVIGQLLTEWYTMLNLPENVVKIAVPST
ncbi:MAG: SpoVA/SpoVAEb family sporulation membrane protein, partial [Clostridia bacterium]|nr:SpoVA/SpoVAEb family sporulation membrane protein [Clostridia bacterium]